MDSAMSADPFAAAKRASAEIHEFLEADKKRRAQPHSSSNSSGSAAPSAAPLTTVPSAPLRVVDQASIMDEYRELLKATGELPEDEMSENEEPDWEETAHLPDVETKKNVKSYSQASVA